jgi:hypothetical protein
LAEVFSRDGILGHQLNKRLESLGPCFSQSLLLADFKEKKTILFSGFKKSLQKNPQEFQVYQDQHFVERKKRLENKTKTRV